MKKRIAESLDEFINETLNEAKVPKFWDSMFAVNVTKAYKNNEFDIDNKKSIED